MNARDVRWLYERTVVQVAILVKHLRFPLRVDIEWVGVRPSRLGADVWDEWLNREFVREYLDDLEGEGDD